MIREKPRENVVADRLTRFTPWLPDGSSSERCTGCGRRVYASEMALSLDGAVFHSRCALYESQSSSR